jgi:cytochrome P450
MNCSVLFKANMAVIAMLNQLQSQDIITALCTLPAIYVLSIIIYRIWFHPLAKYPGPFLSKFTDIYPMVAMFKMTRLYWQYDMLKTYGSPVRASTNQLFFSDAKSWVDIYGQSSTPCTKESVFYDHLSATGATSVLNEKGKKEHARVRRLLSHAFSLNALLKDETLVRKRVEVLDDVVFKPAAAKGEPVDIFSKMMCHFLDISSFFSFGTSFDSVSGRGEISHQDMDCL